MRLKFLCPDADQSQSQNLTEDEMHLTDAKKFKEMIKQEFVDYRTKFRTIMNSIRTDHYDEFTKMSAGKESSRVGTEEGK